MKAVYFKIDNDSKKKIDIAVKTHSELTMSKFYEKLIEKAVKLLNGDIRVIKKGDIV